MVSGLEPLRLPDLYNLGIQQFFGPFLISQPSSSSTPSVFSLIFTMLAKFAALAALVASANAQAVCSLTAETHPSLSWSKCTSSGCSNVAASVTIDANWRWLHTLSGSTNCYNGNKWDTSICSTNTDCATKCCVDGAEYSSTYGIQTSGNSLSLQFVTKGQYSTNVGSRTYLMNGNDAYQGSCSSLPIC